MPRTSVHLLMEPSATVLAHLRERLMPEIDLTVGEELPSNPDFEILVGGRARKEQIEASPNLRTLIIPWSGLQPAMREMLAKMPQLAVHNLHHNARPAAEMALALLFAAAKATIPMDRSLRSNDWSPRYEPNPSVLLTGRHAVVLGYGAIGRHVGEMCRGLGMRVTGIRRHIDKTLAEDPTVVRGIEYLRDLLPTADAVIVSLPLTTRTVGILGPDEIALLPRHAIVVNVARGPLIDEQALYDALRTRAIHAAGLDAWYTYPKSPDERATTSPSKFPFSELDDVVMSPHRAGALGNEASEFLRMEALAGSLNAAARGEEIPSRVDLEEGY